ncbi:MAG TPA: hypothetical protein VF631_05795 [Allosphingosinicella sp.]|jgi:hypothetical protein|uniref:hypothetical protein n=1 Tax=Allosphingosinicella sp. TaxID=2823234 RepID=UPI002F27C503
MRSTISAALVLLAALAPATVEAQSRADRQRQEVRRVIVYGNDPCPRGTGEIVVCARRPESERYRIPQTTRNPEAPAVRSNLGRDQEAREAAATGIGSCSPSGPGGASGCLQQQINRSRVGMDGKQQGATTPNN